MSRDKPMMICPNHLTIPPRWYAFFSYRPKGNGIVVTGKKWDVTDQIREILKQYGSQPKSHKEGQ